MAKEYAMRIGGGIGDCMWEFSILPNLKIMDPDCCIKLYLGHGELYPFIEGMYDETINDHSSIPNMFFMESPEWGKIDWSKGGHLIDLLPGMLKHYYNVNTKNYYKMPYGRFFIENFKPKDFYICFCTRTSDKSPTHRRNPPIEIFHKTISNINCQFVQIGEIEDEFIDLPNVIDARGKSMFESVMLIVNAGMFYGLQSGLRIIAESIGTPLVCYHNRNYSTYDLPLAKYFTRCIFGVAPKITDPAESIQSINEIINQCTDYFHGCKNNIVRCKSKTNVDAVPENSTVVVDWKDIPLEIYAKTVAINKKIKVLLEK